MASGGSRALGPNGLEVGLRALGWKGGGLRFICTAIIILLIVGYLRVFWVGGGGRVPLLTALKGVVAA